MKKSRNIIISILFVIALFCLRTSAQPILTNLNATMWATPGALIQINGSANIVNNYFHNDGRTIIDGDFINQGLTEGDGIYEVTGNWINDNTFDCGTSTVKLTGGVQLITSNNNTSTTFYDLLLQGTAGSIKRQTVDASVKDLLDLLDHELATDVSIMFITTPNVNAITRTTGFVSSLGNGRLSRITNSANSYLFPVGSSLITTRYRPVELTPTAANPNTYAIKLANNNATIDGYDIAAKDDSLCWVNNLFYHVIERTNGITPANIKMYYIQVNDGIFDVITHWGTPPTPVEWHVTAMNNVTGVTNMDYVSTVNSWNNFPANKPFALGLKGPSIFNLTGPTQFCNYNESSFTYTVGGPVGDKYSWTITGGTIIGCDSCDTVVVKWDSTSVIGTVSVLYKGQNCNSKTLTFNVIIYRIPFASFTYTPTTNIYEDDLISFINNSLRGSFYHWNFGDGKNSQQFNPYHIYGTDGKFTIMLIVETNRGCLDTAYQTIDIPEGMDVPNVITPNGDGYNDYFKLRSSGIKEFKMVIYNRWGNLIWENTDHNVGWDGKTKAGIDATEGTYYYIISAKSDTKAYSKTGYVTLLR
ncbi:MAG: gliding motility-associated C-terminal domain-containing protein [Bacteroidales bacterium]|nr:gliding motility-associated C-terminal domain-containing protein [Bacteroidales bacterium]